jgi:RimJ/RimL family protein N-acetyltransferase
MRELITKRVRLRSLRDDDFDALYETVFSDPEVSWSRTARSREDSRTSFDDKLAHASRHGFGMMAVTDRTTGEVLGYAGLQHLEDGPDVEVGYYLGRGSWGRGIATEVARCLVEYGLTDLALSRIVAVVRPDNGKSRNVLAKSGLQRVGTGHHYGADVEIWSTEPGAGD